MAENFPFFQADGIDLRKLPLLEKEAYKQIKNTTKNFVASLQHNGAEIKMLSGGEADEYKQNWFAKVVPDDKKQKALDCHCFDSEGSYTGYLWHVFSFEILNCIKGNEAKISFNSMPKQDAVLLSNWPIGITSCEINNISKINADSFDFLIDVIVIDCNFGWTYVKTHEAQCGPYFYHIRK